MSAKKSPLGEVIIVHHGKGSRACSICAQPALAEFIEVCLRAAYAQAPRTRPPCDTLANAIIQRAEKIGWDHIPSLSTFRNHIRNDRVEHRGCSEAWGLWNG